MGVYPFMFGCVKDFQPIVDELVEVCQKDRKIDLIQVIIDIHVERV